MAGTMTDEQQAIAIIIGCLMAVGIQTEANENFDADLEYAAKLLGIDLSELPNIMPSNCR